MIIKKQNENQELENVENIKNKEILKNKKKPIE